MTKRGRPRTANLITRCPVCHAPIIQCTCQPSDKPRRVRRANRNGVSGKAWQVEPMCWELER